MTAWILPSDENLATEYMVEVQFKGGEGRWFEDKAAFLAACAEGEVVELDEDFNSLIAYRSNTRTKDQLLNLIRGYASYPEFRNEKTVDNLYERIGNEESMTMPIVMDFGNHDFRVLCGNTRLDVAFQLGKTPKVLVIKANR